MPPTPKSCFREKTVDDLLHEAIEEVQRSGDKICPSRGPALEIRGVVLELTNPRARLSRTENRGKLYSCLGELCWYLAGSSDLAFIQYYIPRYKDEADGERIVGGYGPRLHDWKDTRQLHEVISRLRKNKDSRKTVIQLFDARDLMENHKSVPCTCALQFMSRSGKLHLVSYMRSNDVYIGLPHDMFAFTMLQEIAATDLGLELGTYKHTVGSLHLYDSDTKKARLLIDEGWQTTLSPMPPMPVGDPWPSIRAVLRAEEALRTRSVLNAKELQELDPYWRDLVRILQILAARKANDSDAAKRLRSEVVSQTYKPFIEGLLRKMR